MSCADALFLVDLLEGAIGLSAVALAFWAMRRRRRFRPPRFDARKLPLRTSRISAG